MNLQHGDTTSLLATVAQMQTDLKARVEKERAAAAENDGMLSAIAKSMAQIEFDLDGTIRTANSNFLNAVGYSLDEIKGHHHSMFVPTDDANRHRLPAILGQARSGQHDAGQYRRVGKGGREIWLQASYNPILDAAGKPFKVVKFATDVTEQVRTTEEVRALAQSAADGDLTRRVRIEGKSGNLLALSQAINSMADGMTSMVSQIRTAVEAVRSGTDEISTGNTNLSQRTEEQASSLEQTASSMEEMTSTVKQNADNAAQANDLATAARSQAEKGGDVVAEAVAADDGHQRRQHQDRGHHRRHRRDRVPDQPPGSERRRRSGARRRAGSRIRRRGAGGSHPRLAQRRCRERDQGPHRGQRRKVEHGSRLVSQSGQSLSDIVGAGQKGERHRGGDRRRVSGAGARHRPGQQGHHLSRPGHSAERGVGRGSRLRRRVVE